MTFTEKLKETLEGYRKHERFSIDLLSQYIHLLEILILKDKSGLDWIYDYQKEFPDSDNWFYSFHKNFRQCDVFEISIKVPLPKLTEEQEKRYDELRILLKQKPDDWLNNQSYRDLIDEVRPLRDIKYDDGYRSIGGHLDMLFWNTISMDKKGVLCRIMEHLFEDLNDGLEKL